VKEKRYVTAITKRPRYGHYCFRIFYSLP
jgi:hypothetical protein